MIPTFKFSKLKFLSPPLLLVLSVLSLFWPALLHPYDILVPAFSPFSDLLVIHWPKAHLMAQSWQAGEGLPHWTPLILSGMPLAANQLAMLFYPPAWLFLVLPTEPVFNILFIFHLLLGAFGVYLLLHRAHSLSSRAALLGGLTFALNGKWLAHAAGGHVSLVAAVGWLPWVLCGVQMLLKEDDGSTVEVEARQRGSMGAEGQRRNPPCSPAPLPPYSGWLVLAAVALAMQIITHTLLLIYTVYLLAAMIVWHILVIRTENRLAELERRFLPLVMIPILAGLLGAVQLLPLLELAQYSNRVLSLSEATEFSLSPAQLLVGLFLPSTQAGHELVIYLGLVPLLLAPFGISRRNRWTWFYGLLFIFAILFALGPSTPMHRLFYYLAPGFRWVRTPARMFFMGAVAVAILVGFGVDHLAQKQWSLRQKKWLVRLAVAVGAFALLIGLGLAIGFDQVNRSTLALAMLVPLGLTLILLRVQRTISAPLAATLLGLLLFLDLAPFDLSMLRFIPLEEALRPGRSAVEYLAQQPGFFRVYSPSYSLPMQTAAATHLQLADGVEPVHLAVYDQYMARAGGYGDASFTVTIPNFGPGPPESALSHTEPNLKLLGLLNVEYLASAFPMPWPDLTLETEIDGTFIYRNERASPRAWVVHQTRPIEADWLSQLEVSPDLASVALVDGEAPVSRSVQPSAAQIIRYSGDSVEIETEIEQPGWLVMSEIWYPGWRAIINDSPQPVERVNGLLRGVYLSQPGRYQITMEYRPVGVAWGKWISGISAGLLILFLAANRVIHKTLS